MRESISHTWLHLPHCKFADSMLQGVVREGNHADVCSDYRIGAGVAERNSQLSSGLYDPSCMKSWGSKYQTYSIEKDLGLGVKSEFNPVPLVPKSTADVNALCLDSMNICELQKAFRNVFRRDTCVRDKQWLIRRMLFGVQNLSEIGNVSGLVESELSSIENEISMIWSTENDLSEMMYTSCADILDSGTLNVGYGGREDVHAVQDDISARSVDDRVVLGLPKEQEGTSVNGKRLRRRPRRYIEESSEMKSRCSGERKKSPLKNPNDRLLHLRKRSTYYRKWPTGMEVGSGTQISCGLLVPRVCSRRDTTYMTNLQGDDSCASEDASEEDVKISVVPNKVVDTWPSDSYSPDELSDDSSIATSNGKSGFRRQQHNQWTVSEVMELIEGVSQFGVGRWTEIKRQLFSTSTLRTPVDLKDKWRNLLRASGAKINGRKKFRPQKHMTVPLPETALQRIRELAIIHPYPREKKKYPWTTTSRSITR